MRFNLDFDMDNAAFEGDAAEGEVARILRNIAEKIEIAGLTEGAVYDINGNRVGAYEVIR